jgi:hypothetical protein
VTEIKQQQLKNEARARLEKLNLKRIVLSASEFQWTEAGKEITIHGELFDIKSYSQKNGKFIFFGLFDKEETTLDKLEHDWRNNQEESKFLTQLFQVLQSVIHNSTPTKAPDKKLANQYPYPGPDKLQFQSKKVITPPPRA